MRKKKHKAKYNDKDIIEALHEVNNKLQLGYLNGRLYKDNLEEHHPSMYVIVTHVGGIKKAIEMAGIPFKVFAYRGNLKTTKENVIKDIQEFYKKHGKISSHMYKNTKSRFTTNTASRLFGSWSNALKEAGIKCQKYKYSKKELIQILKDKYKEYNCISYEICLYDNNMPDPTTYIRLFGSWNNALKEAKIPKQNLREFGHFKRIITKAEDGHICDSKVEAFFDNWLYNNNILHSIHKKYPNSKKMCDFYCNEIYIEIAGLLRGNNRINKLYKTNIKKKQKLAESNNIKLIIINYEDALNLNYLNKYIKPRLIGPGKTP